MPKIEIDTSRLSSDELRKLRDDMLSWVGRIGAQPVNDSPLGGADDIKDLMDGVKEIEAELSARKDS